MVGREMMSRLNFELGQVAGAAKPRFCALIVLAQDGELEDVGYDGLEGCCEGESGSRCSQL